MSAIRSILLHVDTSGGSAARLAFGHALADRHGAHLTALFGVGPVTTQAAFAYSAGAAVLAAETRDAPIDAERERLRSLAGELSQDCTWCDVIGDSLVHGFVAEAAYADLLVLGPPAAAGGVGSAPPGFVDSVVLQSGTPAIVVPHPHRQETVGDCVLVAWNGSPQAARALRAAMPLLERATQVHVATWARQPPAAPFSGLGVHGWLRQHGIASRVHRRNPSPHVADELTSFAAELGADLIVMGSYGHSKLREQVFGGVTRALLSTLPVPVLMAH
jgi:nucleotide-binding universal stress UspA family protein